MSGSPADPRAGPVPERKRRLGLRLTERRGAAQAPPSARRPEAARRTRPCPSARRAPSGSNHCSCVVSNRSPDRTAGSPRPRRATRQPPGCREVGADDRLDLLLERIGRGRGRSRPRRARRPASAPGGSPASARSGSNQWNAAAAVTASADASGERQLLGRAARSDLDVRAPPPRAARASRRAARRRSRAPRSRTRARVSFPVPAPTSTTVAPGRGRAASASHSTTSRAGRSAAAARRPPRRVRKPPRRNGRIPDAQYAPRPARRPRAASRQDRDVEPDRPVLEVVEVEPHEVVEARGSSGPRSARGR